MSGLTPDSLLDPSAFNSPLDISGYSSSQLLNFYRQLVLIRKVELCLANKRRDGLIGGPVHLGVGQEAVAVGLSSSLCSSDAVFGAHRSHSHILALGSDPYRLFAEVLGKETGLSKGMGGSMHLCDPTVGFYGSVPIVAGTVPIAVGASLGFKYKSSKNISVAYFGDGACEEGVVHESLNLASTLNLPVLFAVENNLFSSHMHISLRQPSSFTSRFAAAHHIEYATVDGNDVLAVEKAARHAVDYMRDSRKPYFLEFITYRWLGHVDWRDDIDVGVCRSEEELALWKMRDPISRLESSLLASNLLSSAEILDIAGSIDTLIHSSWEQALSDPYPVDSSLLNRVFASSN